MSRGEDRKRWERILDAVGIHHPQRGGWWFYLLPRFFAVLSVGALFLLVVFAGVARYSESPSFCRSCHIMEPYYQAWASSKHNKVACVECHYPPSTLQTHLWKKFQAVSQVVKYVTRTYSSRPFAEVDDAACLRCHSTRLLEGKLITKNNVMFDHRLHLTQSVRGRHLRCVSCHSQAVVGRHIEVTYETCFLCHFKGMGEASKLKPLGGCLGCHVLPSKTFQIGNMKFNHKNFVSQRGLSCQNCHVEVVQGKGEVPQDRCLTCHNQPEKIARYSDSAFIHENHVTKHHVACFHCHEYIQHGFGSQAGTPLPKPGEPQVLEAAPKDAKHTSVLAFECAFCHQGMHEGQLEMYTGKAKGLDLPEMPSPMQTANVSCIGCHYQQKVDPESQLHGSTFKASDQACMKCHGEKFNGVWQEAKSQLAATVAEIEAKEKTISKALENSAIGPQDKLAWLARLEQASRLRRFVQASRGEHNIYLASLALRRADEKLAKLAEEMKVDAKDISALPLISGSFCATMCHERVGVKVPPETVQAFGKTMPHIAHTQLMGCVQCHEIGPHKKVPLKANVQEVCRTCHPQ